MRELKFRIWVKDEERYYDETDEESYQIIPNGQVTYTSEAYEEDGVFYTDTTNATNNVVVEQYTGLKDKNGKEIYEGDIVRIDSMDELRVGYVELVADQYCIVCGEDEEGYKVVAEFYYYSKPEENCEVIGNIHENPELLEDEG